MRVPVGKDALRDACEGSSQHPTRGSRSPCATSLPRVPLCPLRGDRLLRNQQSSVARPARPPHPLERNLEDEPAIVHAVFRQLVGDVVPPPVDLCARDGVAEDAARRVVSCGACSSCGGVELTPVVGPPDQSIVPLSSGRHCRAQACSSSCVEVAQACRQQSEKGCVRRRARVSSLSRTHELQRRHPERSPTLVTHQKRTTRSPLLYRLPSLATPPVQASPVLPRSRSEARQTLASRQPRDRLCFCTTRRATRITRVATEGPHPFSSTSSTSTSGATHFPPAHFFQALGQPGLTRFPPRRITTHHVSAEVLMSWQDAGRLLPPSRGRADARRTRSGAGGNVGGALERRDGRRCTGHAGETRQLT